MTSFVRWSGLCLVGAGLLTLPTVAHPDILELGLADASLTTFWTGMHAVGLAVVALSLVGLAGLALVHGRTWGRLGTVAVAVSLVGLVAAAGLTALEAFAFPPLARADPALLEYDGPIAGAAPFWILAGLAGLWLLGETLLGVAVVRAGLLPRGPGILLAVGAASFAAFEGPFVPVLGKVAVVVFAAGQMWLGLALVRASQSLPAALPPSSRSRNRAEMR